MSRLRLVLITRRFWPLVGGAETAMERLAHGLQAAGCEVTLLTARWEPNWSRELNHNGLRVIRLDQPQIRFWGTWRYVRGVTNWLRREHANFDLAYVSMLKHDAYAAISAGQTQRFPVVLRAEGAGVGGDMHFQQTAHFGGHIRSRCRSAQRIIAPSAAIEQELYAAGYAAERIVPIPNGVPVPPAPERGDKEQARLTLLNAPTQMFLPPQAKLAVFTGRLHEVKGLSTLVAAWPLVLEHSPGAHLWLVGEGPARYALERQIIGLGLRDRVILAGPFDNVEDVLRAADVFVLPSREEGMSLALLEALSHEVPVIATNIAGNREVVTDGEQGLLIPPQNPEVLAAKILQLFENRELAGRLGANGRLLVRQRFDLNAVVERHLQLFAEVLVGAPKVRDLSH